MPPALRRIGKYHYVSRFAVAGKACVFEVVCVCVRCRGVFETRHPASHMNSNFFAMIGKLSGRSPFSQKISSLTWLLETDEPAKIFNMLSAFAKAPEEKIKMADYDVAIKSGKLEYEEALLDLVISG